MDGMKEYYLSDITLAKQTITKKNETETGKKLIEEFVKAIKEDNPELLKEKAFKAIGKLFVEIENKYLLPVAVQEQFQADLSIKLDNHFLKLLETPKEQLRVELRNLLENKLFQIKSRKKNSKITKPILVGKDEFIGEDEVVVAPSKAKSKYAEEYYETTAPDSIETESESKLT